MTKNLPELARLSVLLEDHARSVGQCPIHEPTQTAICLECETIGCRECAPGGCNCTRDE